MDYLLLTQQDDIAIIKFTRKRIDAALAVKFRDDIQTLIQQGHKKIIFNMEQIEFIDSSGLGALVSVMKNLGGNQQMALCHVKDAVLTVFKLTRMDKIFVIVASEADALARLGTV
ncbi:MAG: STAS domain-containing protein [Pseudomonadales bacterium]|nr:STAS domain-containing protein [Pseudomonadales bacterium]